MTNPDEITMGDRRKIVDALTYEYANTAGIAAITQMSRALVERHVTLLAKNGAAVIESKEEAIKNDTFGVMRVRRATLTRPKAADLA